MRRFLFAILILAWAGQGWGATIYVNDSPNYSGAKVCFRSGGWPDATCSNGTDNTGLRQAHSAAGSGGTVIIAGGTYVGTQLGGANGGTFATQATNGTVRPAVAGDGDATKVGTVILNGNNAAAHVFQVAHAGNTMSNISFTQPANAKASVFIQQSGFTGNDLSLDIGNGGSTSKGVDADCAAACTSTFNRITATGGFQFVQASGNTNHTPTFNYGKISAGTKMSLMGNAVFNNVLFAGYVGGVVDTTGNSGTTATWNNSMFIGNALTGATTVILNKLHDQTWTLNNCLALGNPWNYDGYNFVGVTINNSIQNAVPRFTSPKYPAVLVPMVDDKGTDGDDTLGVGYFEAVASKLQAYGWRGTIAINYPYVGGVSDNQWTHLTTLYNAGHEIANHTRHHPDMTTTTTFTIAKAAKTASVADNVLTTTDNVYTLANYTLAGLRTQMALDGFTVGSIVTAIGLAPATILADFTDTAITSAKTLGLDNIRFRTEEIDNAKTDIESHGITVTSFTFPGNLIDASLQTYLSTRYSGARGGSAEALSSMSAYNIGYRDVTTIGLTTACEAAGSTRTECVRRNTAALLEKMNYVGGIYAVYMHNTTEFALTDWDAFLDVVSKSNVQVMTLTQAANYIKTYDPSEDLATADNITWTRTLIDASDYSLKSSSPAINAGVNVGLTTDYRGMAVPQRGVVDIGAYEFGPGDPGYGGAYRGRMGIHWMW